MTVVPSLGSPHYPTEKRATHFAVAANKLIMFEGPIADDDSASQLPQPLTCDQAVEFVWN